MYNCCAGRNKKMPITVPNIDIFDEKSSESKPLKAMEVEAKELCRIISHLDTLHEEGQDTTHPDTGVIVTDDKYEQIKNRLKELYKQIKISDISSHVIPAISSTLDDVTASKKQIQGSPIKHDPPMVSIDKANGSLAVRKEILIKWIEDCKKGLNLSSDKKLPSDFIAASYKRDGVAVSLYYVKGKLDKAGLRSRDPYLGEDCTANIVYVKNVPQTLSQPLTLCIRGELETLKDVFVKINKIREESGEKLFKNPRNATTGGIKQVDDPTITKSREISFMAHSIEWMGGGSPPYTTEIERAKWCNQLLKIPYVRTEPFNPKILQEMEDKAADLNYEVDGIVLSVNNLEQSEQLGRVNDKPTGNPRGKLAWKFSDETASPILKDILWATGRTGGLTPVGIFDGVNLAQTTVSRCSLHSLGFVLRNGIAVGKRIKIRKSGKIIPECLGIFDHNGTFIEKIDPGSANIPDIDLTKSPHPTICPSCGIKLDITEGNQKGTITLSCSNNKGCPAQNVNMLIHYLQTFGVKGVAEDVCSKLIDNGDIHRPADLYELTVSQLEGAGVTSRNAILAIARIHMIDMPEKIKENSRLLAMITHMRSEKKKVLLSKLLAAFGIPGAGAGTASELSSHFRSLDKIRLASIVELNEVDGIGEATAESVYNFINVNSEAIDALLKHIEIENPKTGKLTGYVICITGGIEPDKPFWRDKVEALGGKMSGSVTKQTTHVVEGDGDPNRAKMIKARELLQQGKIKIISPDDLSDLIKN